MTGTNPGLGPMANHQQCQRLCGHRLHGQLPGVQGDFDARFGGGSLELMGMGSRLRIANDLTDQITIPRFKLSGGTVDYTAEEGSVTVEGSWEVLPENLIDIRGTYNAMYLNASISGDADLRFKAKSTDLASDETLILTVISVPGKAV